MSYYEDVAIRVEVSSRRFCSSLCPYLKQEQDNAPVPAYCQAFLTSLRWDGRRRLDGYVRAEGCKRITCHQQRL